MSAILDALEEERLVERVADPVDRRANVVALGENGPALLEEGSIAAREAHGRFLRPLSVRERTVLEQLLAELEPKSGLAFLDLLAW